MPGVVTDFMPRIRSIFTEDHNCVNTAVDNCINTSTAEAYKCLVKRLIKRLYGPSFPRR